jgi:single-stranded-DNA-specific exonuclease
MIQVSENIISISGRRWLARPHDPREAIAISQQLGLPELMGRILASRGVNVAQAEGFLKPTLREFLPDPFLLKDMEKAAQRIAQEVKAIGMRHEANSLMPNAQCLMPSTIAVFGDYDVDGATSSALLIRYFRALGITPLVHIPDRIKEGYGPNTPALLSLKERGAKLIITVDCGTMAFEPLQAAKLAGLDVIVVDHHKSDTQMPEAYAIVNPNRYDETSPHKQLAACGVTFLLLVAVNKVLRESGVQGPDLLPFLDLVALGTICDVVPLTGANRALVTQGLKVLRARSNTGIAAAMDSARLAEAPGTYHAGFIIGPRINAGGRVGKSDLGVRLLATDDAIEARTIAEELDRFNAERKAIESVVLDEAMQDATALPASEAIIMVARKGWHPGVIGIVAGRLKDHFNKPTAVIALGEGIGKASARSITGIDLGAVVVAATHNGLLLGGGGHAMAAGFTVAEAQLPALRDFFNSQLATSVSALARERTLFIDGTISLQGLTAELTHLIDKAGPFGAGNPSVRLQLAPVRVINAGLVGENHVRVIVTDAGMGGSPGSLKAMAFRSATTPMGELLLNSKGRPLHLAGQARLNQWQGNETVDFFIDDVAC